VLLKKYSGRYCGEASWLALLLLGYRFLSNMLPRRALPSSSRARNPIAGLFFRSTPELTKLKNKKPFRISRNGVYLA
jgi:hypothetical protein